MGDTKDNNYLQYSPLNSFVESSFWHKLCQIKLDVDRLEEKVRPIWGYYSNCDPPGLTGTVQVDCSGFNTEFGAPRTTLATRGTLINKNTVEAFRTCDKARLLASHGVQLWRDIASGAALDDPSLLATFVLLTFADLKKYHFYYWFAFPAPTTGLEVPLSSPPTRLGSVFSPAQCRALVVSYESVSDWRQRGFFAVATDDGDDAATVCPLSRLREGGGEAGATVGFADPCGMPGNPGWPLRSLLALVGYQCPHLVGSTVRVISLRLTLSLPSGWHCDDSPVFQLTLPSPVPPSDASDLPSDVPVSPSNVPVSPSDVLVPMFDALVPPSVVSVPSSIKWVGWERNDRGKFGPRMANLSSSMDPIKLAESSVDLNLKLMKWRLLPDLNLDVVKNTRCLLLGAGTLGCSVARNLLAWGVRTITLADNGRLSYSNPVRQSLYTHARCAQGGELKAPAAAAALKEIFPGVDARGVVLSIPMPGHPIGESLLADTAASVAALDELVANHDAVFLLMDSRESRWLPTVLAAGRGKIVMNAALGFDTYLVMRHGTRHGTTKQQAAFEHKSGQPIPGEELGCYFCNDITAPGNSQLDRSLDQQCTVTRPGVSGIAAALVVELLVSVLQHPLGAGAPADTGSEPGEACVLGLVPHTVRGFLSQFSQVLPSCHRFDRCIACSDKVLSEYKLRGLEFLTQVFNTPHYLEDVTGLTQIKAEADEAEIWELSDSDSGEME